MGSILTSSTDGTIRISTPTQNPEMIAVISSQAGEVTGVSTCGFSWNYHTTVVLYHLYGRRLILKLLSIAVSTAEVTSVKWGGKMIVNGK